MSEDRSRGWNLRRSVMLECPKCGRTAEVAKDRTDPPRTAKVLLSCDQCDSGDFGEANYFDAQGRQIDLEGKPMKKPTPPDAQISGRQRREA